MIEDVAIEEKPNLINVKGWVWLVLLVRWNDTNEKELPDGYPVALNRYIFRKYKVN